MKNWKRNAFCLLLTAMVCLLAACGKEEATPDDAVAGDDWRTTGIVDDYGTITRDGTDTDVCIVVREDDTTFYYDEEEQIYYGSVEYPMNVPDAAVAYSNISFADRNDDGDSDVALEFDHDDGTQTLFVWYWDQEDNSYVFIPEESSVGGLLGDYTGLWGQDGGNRWLNLYTDETWAFVNSAEEVLESGVFYADEEGIELVYDGTGESLYLTLTDDGALYDSELDEYWYRTDEITAPEPYFSANAIAVNATMDDGTFLLEDGVSSYAGLGENYGTGDVYWELITRGDETSDGVRTVTFDACCYIPLDSVGTFSKEFITVTSSELFDYYTGTWLTAATAYQDTTADENSYLHTIEYNGASYEIEFSYSTSWAGRTADWQDVLTKHYVITMPEDYDGLLFAAFAEPDNYRDSAKRMQLDSICPGDPLLDCETLDPERALFFWL